MKGLNGINYVKITIMIGFNIEREREKTQECVFVCVCVCVCVCVFEVSEMRIHLKDKTHLNGLRQTKINASSLASWSKMWSN